MSWVTGVWVLVASACLTLSVLHLMIGIRQRRAANLLFVMTSLAVVAIAGFELALMRSSMPREFGVLTRWIHVPIWVLVAATILFVRRELGAGRAWLAAATLLVRSAALVLNFVVSPNPNLNFVDITGLRQVPFLGETVSVAVGTVSGWTRLGELSSLLFLAFLVDASVTVWRRGEHRRALFVGGSMILFVLLAAGHTMLVHAKIVSAPYVISLCYLGVIAVMSFELTSDVLRANELASTVRRQGEVLHETDQRLGLAADSADLGFWSWDSQTGRLWMSSRARALRGYPPGERLDIERFMASVHPDDRDTLRRVVRDAAVKGDAFELEYRVVNPDGEVRWIALRGAGELYGSGGAHVRGVSIDITRRKQAEAETREREVELAHLSRVAMLGELSGSLAHELSQPLTAILSNAQAAARTIDRGGGSREEIQEILTEIIAESKHAAEVVRKTRGLLRKDTARDENVDLAGVVDEVGRILHRDFVRQGVSFSAELAPDLPSVRGDRVQIVQVLLNLATNACDAMAGANGAGRHLAIGARREPDGAVQVSVADDGAGIPPEAVERLFQPFVTTKPNGLGLGLAVCRTIVGAHGGRIWADNNAQRGASFHFTLPAAEERA